MKNEYPRVLFVTPCAFNRVTGGGITFSNLFRGWPKDRIATIHRDAVAVSHDVCSQYYRLGWSELTPSVPLSGGVLNWGHLTRPLASWVQGFAPEVIYTILGTIGYIDLVRAIQERFRLPVVTHLMDEGVTDPQIKGWFAPWIRQRYHQVHRSMITSAVVRLGICDKMSETYSQRYGVPFETFMNTVDIGRWPARTEVQQQSVLRLVYTGSVLPFAQDQSLRDICTAVISLHREGMPIRFDIYTPLELAGSSLEDMTNPQCVFVHPAIEDDQVYFEALKSADILVSPVNFDPNSIHFIRYSMPTKIPSYLSSGTPILVYGPKDVAQVEYAEKDKWGMVVSRRDPDLLKQSIQALAKDHTLRKTLSDAAQATARRNHDSAHVRKRFQALLAEVAHG